ncbi:cysteine-rich venom protein TEL1-like [Antedon mediterranea]|uniref:cysteine-rich venom protein TEL1-like n=1 Tax=Antedon mediterranea TaxID=105859 RepID=UPI003AF9E017
MASASSAWLVCVLAIWCIQNCCGLTPVEKARSLKTHNMFRANVKPKAANMRILVWDKKAEAVAQEWADNCNQFHRSNLGDLGMGENLAFSSRPYVGKQLDSGIRLWFDEVKDYNYATGSCRSGAVCGHYTQVVDTRSLAVGCATNRKKCSKGFPYMFVCNYSPPGNYNGEKPYEAGLPCSGCQSDTRYCKAGLFCSDCKPGSSGCDCRINCGKGNAKNPKACSCKCRGSWGAACQKKCVNGPACTGKGYDKWRDEDVCPHPFFAEACAAKCQKSCKARKKN